MWDVESEEMKWRKFLWNSLRYFERFGSY